MDFVSIPAVNACAFYADIFRVVAIFVSGGVGGLAEKFQQEWMKVLQKRVGITSTMLSAMKGVKMTGLTPKLGKLIQGLRMGELKTARKYRHCFTALIILGTPPYFLSSDCQSLSMLTHHLSIRPHLS